MKLIITEKESVAQQFAKVLGVTTKEQGYMHNDEWIITWAMGHLIALSYPEKYDESLLKWKMEDLPFLPEKYKYEVIPDKFRQFKIVKSLLNLPEVDIIFDGGDSGREGQYIQTLIYSASGILGKKKIMRVWLNTTTEDEIRRGLREAKPESAYDNLTAAAYERAIADYAVGINLSRALSCKYGSAFNRSLGTIKHTPISVGRVMTCVLGMIVNREREIRNFKPTDYYKLDTQCHSITAHWKAGSKSRYYNSDLLYNDTGFKEKADAQKLLAEFQADPRLQVTKLEKKLEKGNAPLLYNLAELQSDCSKKYKISPADTLDIAQVLYEKRLTTYPRTDARVLSSSLVPVIDKHIIGVKNILGWGNFVDPIMQNGWYKGLGRSKYVNDALIKDHYAIIPTGEGGTALSELTSLQRTVYELICKRFLSVFYPPAEYNKTNLELTHMASGTEVFSTSEKILVKPGYLIMYQSSEPNAVSDPLLLQLKQGDVINGKFSINTATTKAPPRYTSGNMILAMESAGKLIEDEELRAQIKGSGIGTSATRADTIKKLVGDEHISLDPKTQNLAPTAKGELIYDIVEQTVPKLLRPDMTASWERGLTQIEDGKISAAYYRNILYGFVRDSVETIKSTDINTFPEPAAKANAVIGKCPRCGRDIVENRKAFGCVGYRDKENPCSFAIWKNHPLLAKSGKAVTASMAKSLLKSGKCTVNNLKSAKGSKYSCTLNLEDTDGKVNLRVSFDTPKKFKK